MAGGRWNPWVALAASPGTVVEWRAGFRSTDAVSWPDEHGGAVMLRRGLTQVERRCLLSHELVHLERGGGSVHPDPIVRAREERAVDRIVAARLVPEDELTGWLSAQEDPVTVDDVCEHWRVTPEYALIALQRAR
jgi:hypothetical protein